MLVIEQIQVWTRSPGVCVTVRSDRNTDKLQHKVQALVQVSQSPERQGWAGLRAAPSRCRGSIRAWVWPHVLRGLLHLATTALRTSKGRRDGKGSDRHECGPRLPASHWGWNQRLLRTEPGPPLGQGTSCAEGRRWEEGLSKEGVGH